MMLIKPPAEITSSEITDPSVYQDRRRFLKIASTGAVALASGGLFSVPVSAEETPTLAPLQHQKNALYTAADEPNSYKDITRYNNFYEFGTDKEDPARLAHTLRPAPWRVRVEGEVATPADYHLDDLINMQTLEERIYRLRCVEAWSMVIPWIGVPLSAVIQRLQPTSAARYVAFTTLLDPQQMPGQRRAVLTWPYVEGLRMDEALHPLSFLAVGLYGRVLPNQNGAPIRLVVPWKYGFKSIKSIVNIRFTRERPATAWNVSSPKEYGFYANVNPGVDHPRWSQARERRIGEFFKRKTLAFNGYAEQVAGLYSGMDLRRDF